jgi:serine/threonine-protein kinase
MLLALGAIGLVAIGLLLALLLFHRDDRTSTTVVVTTPPAATTPTTTARTRTTPASVAIPDLVGETATNARARLRRLGLRATLTPATSTQQAGTIVDQAPRPGAKATKGGVVTLSVARAASATTATTNQATTTTAPATTTQTTPQTPTSSTMPDVGGQTVQAAATALSRAGVLPSLVFVPASQPLGTVVQQAKQPGTTLPYHTHVQLNLSRGPGQKPDVQVPNVVGRTLTDAVSALNAAKLRLIYVRFPVASQSEVGKVVQQSPLGGGKAPQNAQVLVFLGVRPR